MSFSKMKKKTKIKIILFQSLLSKQKNKICFGTWNEDKMKTVIRNKWRIHTHTNTHQEEIFFEEKKIHQSSPRNKNRINSINGIIKYFFWLKIFHTHNHQTLFKRETLFLVWWSSKKKIVADQVNHEILTKMVEKKADLCRKCRISGRLKPMVKK